MPPGPVPGPRYPPGVQAQQGGDYPPGPRSWRGQEQPGSRPGRARGQGSRPRSATGRKRAGLALTVLALALGGVVASALGLAAQILPRSFSAAQRQQIVSWEMGKRWRTWPAGEIFPKTIRYRLPGPLLGGGADLILDAYRIGIARQASCQAATDAKAADVLVRHGCLAVLRATYDDATQSLAVTVGVAVLPSLGAATASGRELPSGKGLSPGVRAAPFRRTLVARFGNRQRQLSLDRVAGPYLVFATVGYADGRRRQPGADPYARSEMLSVADGIAGWVASHLGVPPPPPHCPGAPAC